MSFADADLSRDGFLNGKLQILQPKSGYRAATDPVFLAAAVDARAGQSVLELGCGAGVASLCLGWRVAGLVQTGLEIQPEYAELARRNAQINAIPFTVHVGDLRNLPPEIGQTSFDHVIFNPPYFGQGAFSAPVDSGKKIAHVEQATLAEWVRAGFKRLRPRGQMSLIHLAERLPDILAGLPRDAGDIVILPLAPRVGRDAKRVIVTARKSSNGPARLCAPFFIHQGESHIKDGDDFSKEARAILRDGTAIALT